MGFGVDNCCHSAVRRPESQHDLSCQLTPFFPFSVSNAPAYQQGIILSHSHRTVVDFGRDPPVPFPPFSLPLLSPHSTAAPCRLRSSIVRCFAKTKMTHNSVIFDNANVKAIANARHSSSSHASNLVFQGRLKRKPFRFLCYTCSAEILSQMRLQSSSGRASRCKLVHFSALHYFNHRTKEHGRVEIRVAFVVGPQQS